MAWGHAEPYGGDIASVSHAGGANFNLGQFVEEVWTGKLKKPLEDSIIVASRTNREFEGDIKRKGDAVRFNMVGNVHAKNYAIPANRGTALSNRGTITYELATGASMVFRVDQAKYVAFEIEDIEEAMSNPKYLSSLMERSGVALAQERDRYVLSTMIAGAENATSDDFGQVGGSSGGASTLTISSGNMYDLAVDLSVVADDNLMPQSGRWFVIPTSAKANVLKDDQFVANGQDPGNSLKASSNIGRLAGWDMVTVTRPTLQKYDSGDQSTQVPADTTTNLTSPDTYNVTGPVYTTVAGHNDATTFAAKLQKSEQVRLEGSFADAYRNLDVFGAKVVRPQWLFSIDFTDA